MFTEEYQYSLIENKLIVWLSNQEVEIIKLQSDPIPLIKLPYINMPNLCIYGYWKGIGFRGNNGFELVMDVEQKPWPEMWGWVVFDQNNNAKFYAAD